MENKQKRMADEMDINLEVFNLETDFFGALHCSSRFTDMLCDAQAQYQNYSELDMCPMWGMWEKKGENEIKALRKCVGGLKIKFAMSSRQTKYYELMKYV